MHVDITIVFGFVIIAIAILVFNLFVDIFILVYRVFIDIFILVCCVNTLAILFDLIYVSLIDIFTNDFVVLIPNLDVDDLDVDDHGVVLALFCAIANSLSSS